MNPRALPASRLHPLRVFLRRAAFATLPLLPFALPASAAEPAAATQQRYAIPAGPLEAALNRFGREAGILLSFPSQLTSGLRSPGLSGEYSIDDGLAALLQGTGLAAAKQANGSYSLRKLPVGDEVTLKALNVTASEDRYSQHLATAVSSGALGARSQLDTPFSMTVVGSDELQARQAWSLDEVFKYDASVFANTSERTDAASISIRGLLPDGMSGSKLDGLPVTKNAVDFPIEMFERVELLKGLSGFMYGFGSPGGIVNYVLKKPTDERTASVAITRETGGVVTGHVDAGGRVGDEGALGYRINAVREEGDTFNEGSIDRRAFAVGMDARIAPTLKAAVDVLYQKSEKEGGINGVSLDFYSDDDLPSTISGRTKLASDGQYYDTEYKLAKATLEWAFATGWRAQLSALTGRYEQRYADEWLFVEDAGGTYSDEVYEDANRGRFELWQLMVDGSVMTGAIRHQLVAGVEWREQLADYNELLNYTVVGPGNLFASNPNTYASVLATSWYRGQNRTQKAVFASDTMQFGEQWSLLLGLRYTDYEQTGYDETGAVASDYDETPLSPTVAVLFKPRTDTTLYVSYVESLQQGGSTRPGDPNHPDELAPLTSKQYELGFKTERRDWSATAAVFRIEQGAEYINDADALVQDGEVHFQGLEIAGAWRPTSQLHVAGSVMWLDAEYREGEANVDNRVDGTAPVQAALQTTYQLAHIDGLKAHAGVRYVGRTTLNATNTMSVPDYHLVDVGISYQLNVADTPVTLAAEIKNLANRDYWHYQGDSWILPGSPRTVGLSARVNF